MQLSVFITQVCFQLYRCSVTNFCANNRVIIQSTKVQCVKDMDLQWVFCCTSFTNLDMRYVIVMVSVSSRTCTAYCFYHAIVFINRLLCSWSPLLIFLSNLSCQPHPPQKLIYFPTHLNSCHLWCSTLLHHYHIGNMQLLFLDLNVLLP